jgi:replicative DNA helicase
MLQGISFDPFKDGLPVAVLAERFLLGACLRHGRMNDVASQLLTDDFGQETHRFLWEIMREIHEAGQDVNYSTIALGLDGNKEDVGRVGGIGYVVDLENGLPNVVDVEPYIREIRDKSMRRRLIFKCNETMLRLADKTDDATSIAIELEEESRKCAAMLASRNGFSTIKEIIAAAGGLDAYLGQRNEEGVRYPWASMNRITGGGMRAGNLIVLAGSTGDGKTALALNLAHHAARQRHGVAIFSLEMDKQEITDRMISIESHMDGRVLRQRPDAAERGRIRDGVANLFELSLFVHDATSPSIRSIRAELKRLMAKERIGLVILDYIQLVEAAVRKNGNRAEEVGGITRSLKRLARDFKLPVVALSQLNRESAKEKRREPLAAKETNDNLMFTKPPRSLSSSRIDGISATVNALVRAIVDKGDGGMGQIEIW